MTAAASNDNTAPVPPVLVPRMQAAWALHSTSGGGFKEQVLALTQSGVRGREGGARRGSRLLIAA